ncbi:MAG: hypothetical protein LBI40_00930 [Treponema sp.]|jgi:hypothetical protein|nr:hypothetical protein [Treponema sp.]
MRSFILNLIVTIVFFVGGVLYFRGDIGLFFVPVPLLVTVLFPLIFQCILYGSFSKKAFSIIFENDCSKHHLQKAYSFFKHYEQVIWITAVTLIALFVLICMKYLEDKSGLGMMFQFILDTIVYAGLLHLVIALPYKIIIRIEYLTILTNKE